MALYGVISGSYIFFLNLTRTKLEPIKKVEENTDDNDKNIFKCFKPTTRPEVSYNTIFLRLFIKKMFCDSKTILCKYHNFISITRET